ncbi:hypothetical protein ACUOFC_48395 [Escherichia sp. TWPC-MK]
MTTPSFRSYALPALSTSRQASAQVGGVMARYNLHDYMDDQHEWLDI